MAQSDSMFTMLGSDLSNGTASQQPPLPDVTPAPADITLKTVQVETYQLWDSSDVARYRKDMKTLLNGTTSGTHMILAKEPLKFVDTADGSGYLAHLQWAEFKKEDIKYKSTPVKGKAEEQK